MFKGLSFFKWYFIVFFLIILLLNGWIQNIIKLSNCDFEAPYKCEVIHAIGIIPPVGIFTGYMDFSENENTTNE